MQAHPLFIRGAVLAFLVAGTPLSLHAEEMLMALRLNGDLVSDGEIVVMDIGGTGGASLPPETLQRLRFRIPPHILAAKPSVIPLDRLPGVRTHIDVQAQVVDIDAEWKAFETTVVQNYVPLRPADTPDTPGLFLNYDVVTQRAEQRTLSSGLVSLGAFTPLGTFFSDASGTSEAGFLRLRNYFVREHEAGDGSLLVGDGFLTSGAFSETFPFAGIQLTSRPSAATRRHVPLETILGQAAVPSNVDIYVNNSLQSQQNIPAGPFVLENIPLASGDGNIRIVVRDALGQERVLVRSFYTNPQLLTAGEEEYAVESGFLRRSYGAKSFDYAEPFASGTYRWGFSTEVTGEVHSEASEERQMMGAQATVLVAPRHVAYFGAAVSQWNGMIGSYARTGITSDMNPFTFGFSTEFGSSRFTQLGYDDARSLNHSTQAQVSYDFTRYGSLSASFINLGINGQPISRILASSYSVSLADIGAFGASLFVPLRNNGTQLFFNLSVPLGERVTASGQVAGDKRGLTKSIQAVRSIPLEGGVGLRAIADVGPMTKRGELGVTYRNTFNEVTADVGILNDRPAGRFGMNGSVELFAGELFMAHKTDGNFAVVDTNGVGGLRVRADQQYVGTTDADGRLVIPRLRPHEINRIALDTADIPFDIVANAPMQEVVPRGRAGYLVKFDLQRNRTATATLVDEQDAFLPMGTILHRHEEDQGIMVGYDGMVYLTGLTGHDVFEAALPNGTCTAEIDSTEKTEAQPALGRITCRLQPPPQDMHVAQY